LATIWGERKNIQILDLGKNVLTWEGKKIRFAKGCIMGGRKKKSNSRFGEGYISGGREKKENFRF
jgi:hypothetical protein